MSRVVYDFLSNRECIVQIENSRSTAGKVKLGCVQGSVLGPKLFSIYTSDIADKLTKNAEITSYADDSYVVVSAKRGEAESLVKETEECIEKHSQYLRMLGMVVNQHKTEVMWMNNNKATSLKCGDETITTLPGIGVLGMHMDNQMNWSEHVSKTINKLNRLSSGLKFMRRRLTEDQFLKVITSQYYGLCYYGCQVWLGDHTRRMDLKKLDSAHYRMLRIIKQDYRRKIGRHELDQIGRARPSLWSKYSTANLVIKVLRDKEPRRIFDHVSQTLYYKRRQEGVLHFFDASTNKGGYQKIGNRLRETFESLSTTFNLRESNDALRLKLKECLGLMKEKKPQT